MASVQPLLHPPTYDGAGGRGGDVLTHVRYETRKFREADCEQMSSIKQSRGAGLKTQPAVSTKPQGNVAVFTLCSIHDDAKR